MKLLYIPTLLSSGAEAVYDTNGRFFVFANIDNCLASSLEVDANIPERKQRAACLNLSAL